MAYDNHNLKVEWSHPQLVSRNEGRWRAQVKMWESEYLRRYRHSPETLSDEFELFVEENNKLIDGNKNTYALITVNFKDNESNFEALNKKVSKCLDKVWIKDYIANWEFVNKNGDWTHPHIHIFCTKSGLAKSQIIREVHSTFKDYVEKEKIDVKIFRKKDKKKGIDYVKKNRNKDLFWRQKFDLPSNFGKLITGKIMKEGIDFVDN